MREWLLQRLHNHRFILRLVSSWLSMHNCKYSSSDVRLRVLLQYRLIFVHQLPSWTLLSGADNYT